MKEKIGWLAILYLVLESLAFWGAWALMGFGATVLISLALFVGGVLVLKGVPLSGGALADMMSGRSPKSDVLMRIMSGLLMVLPGLLTGVLGAVLMIAPVRNMARSLVNASTRRRVLRAGDYDFRGKGRVHGARHSGQEGGVRRVEGDVIDVEYEEL